MVHNIKGDTVNKESKEIIRKIKITSVPLLKKNGVARASLFGSYARGESTKKSDVDMLIQFKGRKSLLDLAGLEIELESALKKKVDLLTYKSINHLLRDRIIKDEVKIL